MKTRKRVVTLFILGALLLSTVTPVLGAPSLLDDAFSAPLECEQTDSLQVTCTAEVTGGTTPYTFVWDFGDGGPTVTTTVGEVTYTYTEAHTYDVTLTVIDGEADEAGDTVTLAVAVWEPSEHIISNLIAAFFIVPPEDIDFLREEGWGFGEIAKAYFIAQLSVQDVGVITGMRGEGKEGSGWGQIMKVVLGFAGLHGHNLGLIVSGREPPPQLENQANSSEMEGQGSQGQGHGKGQEGQGSQGQGHGKGQEGQGSQGQGHGKEQGSQGQGHGKGKGKGPKH